MYKGIGLGNFAYICNSNIYNMATRNLHDHLFDKETIIKFLSCEPLIEDLGELNLGNIDWVFVGGERGPQARLLKEEWVLSIQEQTERQGSAFILKQRGTWGSDGVKGNKHKNGKLINGKDFHAMPKY